VRNTPSLIIHHTSSNFLPGKLYFINQYSTILIVLRCKGYRIYPAVYSPPQRNNPSSVLISVTPHTSDQARVFWRVLCRIFGSYFFQVFSEVFNVFALESGPEKPFQHNFIVQRLYLLFDVCGGVLAEFFIQGFQ
jgi:hypothetical protein